MADGSQTKVEQRRAPRTATTSRGKIYPGGLDCTIADFSQNGARLHLSRPDSATPSGDIVLVIWSTGAAFEATPRWRDGAEAGWRFLSRFDLRRPVPPRLAEVKAQWLARRLILRRMQLKASGVMINYRGAPRAVQLS
jgi:hypothetical protein